MHDSHIEADGEAMRHEDMKSLLTETIDRLIQFLDQIDDDPDLESTGDDEPSIGNTHVYSSGLVNGDDLEMECDDQMRADDEPSLGAIESVNQSSWGKSGKEDFEFEITDQPHDWDEREFDETDFEGPGIVAGGQGF